MRSWSLNTPLNAPAERAWQLLVDLDQWHTWNGLIPHAAGSVALGQELEFGIRRVDGSLREHRPTVQILDRPDHMMLAADFGHRAVLRMEHHLVLHPDRLEQRWDVFGVAGPVLWTSLTETFARFQRLGDDLQAELTRQRADGGGRA